MNLNINSSSPTTARAELLGFIAGTILSKPKAGILKVAVDGVDGAGKTFFADELGAKLKIAGREVIRASVDGFHNPRAVRYHRGKTPESFFRDSYNYQKLKEVLLDPLSEDGSLTYQTAAFDHFNDSPIKLEKKAAFPGSILVFDGIFLHRPELIGYWDFSLFLDVDFSVSIPRGAARGVGYGSPDPGAESNRRYIEGQQIYFAECHPKRNAHTVIDNNNLKVPRIISDVAK